jgi:hypothetical protein
MTRRRGAPGGGVVVEIPPARLVGWVNRFGGRNSGLLDITTDGASVTVRAADGTVAVLAVPFGPMAVDGREPVEALLEHVAGIGAVGILLVRGGAHSVGVARDGAVLSSSTDRAYLQGRTAAGGWSQQRFARRRGNQRSASYASAAGTAAKVLLPVASSLSGLVVGGDRRGIADVLADPRLAPLSDLPVRSFPDIAEPRRAVLDDVAARAVSVEITVTNPGDRDAVPPHGSQQNGAPP